jgi:hypothetical protein
VLDPSLVSRALVDDLECELGTQSTGNRGAEDTVNFGTEGIVNFATAIAAYELSIRLAALLDFAPANPS